MCADARRGRAKLKVVLCWHMHQPEYRDLRSGRWQQPWTFLHAIKDYVDMAAHLEAWPQAHAVVNWTPVLLEQLDACARDVAAALRGGGPPPDPLLSALLGVPAGIDERTALLRACLRANEKRLIQRFAGYRRVAELARSALADAALVSYLDPQFYRDLVVWYHLAWLGETVRRGDPRAGALMARERGYSAGDARALLALVGELVGGVVGRYRRLGERGQVELSFTPWGHPIVPLLLDLGVTRESEPAAVLPEAVAYPGGEDSARWHLTEGIACFERHFGMRPAGCWLSEGGISDAALALLDEVGIRWTASGEGVLANSLRQAREAHAALPSPPAHRPFAVAGRAVRCFFRADQLSDLIGFTFSDWHADDAVNRLVHELTRIAASVPDSAQHVVSIILDGENAWEHYPDNAWWFLDGLYRRLCTHDALELTTFSRCLEATDTVHALPGVVAGSWVYGTFSTWIGEPDKNRAWDVLAQARRDYIAAQREEGMAPGQAREARLQLGVCESSDWFWWFGDYNPAESVRDFDALYRMHLRNLYGCIGMPPPALLAAPLAGGNAQARPETGGVMRRGAAGQR